MIPPAIGPFLIQDADDYAGGPLASSDVGKFMAVVDRDGQLSFALVNAPDISIVSPGTVLRSGGIAAADVLSKLLTVDGSGSGLDADALDGLDSTAFLLVDGSCTGATSQAQTFTNGIVGPTWRPASNTTTALQVQDAAGAYIANFDTTNKRFGLGTNAPGYQFDQASAETPAGSSSMAFHIGNTGGTELITGTTDRDFSGSGNWTGTNWAVNSGTLKHTTGSTSNAVLANANLTASSIIAGRYYQVTYTITGRTAGTVQPKIGTGLGTAQSVDGTYTDYIAAAADNADLTFTPTSAFDGAIDNVSVQRIATNFAIGNNGKVGIGTLTPTLALEVIDGTNTPLNIVRRSAATSSSTGAFNAVHETSGVALDGFGAHQSFRIKDNTSGTTFTIGTVGAVRDGAQDTGALVFRTTTSNAVNERMRISTNGHIGLGTNAPTARIHVAGNASFAAWGLNGAGLQLAAATFTDSSTAGSGTATNAVAYAFKRPTFAATNASVTMTNVATLYIENSPAAGTNATLTNKYALWVDDGDVRFDGNIGFFAKTPAAQQTGGSATASGTYGATEQGMLQKAYDCLRTFGLLS